VQVGYARGSLDAELYDRQLRTLAAADCAAVYSDTVVGRTADRAGLESCLAALQPGDVLVVATLGRLARSVHELIGLVTRLHDRGATLRSLDGALDTGGPDGRALLAAFAALARYIDDADAEAARDGRASARAAGQRLGRPPVLTPDQVALARRLLCDPAATVASVARRLGVGRSTLYRYLPELTGRPGSGSRVPAGGGRE
jgi:DNA invertase Pin-like site-specific DNA recombinase